MAQKAFLVTVVIKHYQHCYEEYFTLRCSDKMEAENLAWDFMRGGYYWDVDPDEEITANEETHTIEEPYGDRFYSVDSVGEIPLSYVGVLEACRIAWDETERARNISVNLKSQAKEESCSSSMSTSKAE